MAEGRDDGSIAPRRSLSGPILPPPPEISQENSRKAEQEHARQEQVSQERIEREKAAKTKADKGRADKNKADKDKADKDKAVQEKAAEEKAAAKRAKAERRVARNSGQGRTRPPSADKAPLKAASTKAPARAGSSRRARLRLVQVDAWSVMKTSFLLSIALGIVLIVAVAIVWAVLGAAGVWDSINSIVQQAVGGESEQPFDITDYVGTSRVLGFTMLVAVIDVILITAIATLGAFLYNLSAALLGGIEVTLAEDS